MRIVAVCLVAVLAARGFCGEPSTQPTELRYTADPTRNVFAGGTFAKLDSYDKPLGWTDIAAFDTGDATIKKGGGNTVLLDGPGPDDSVRIAAMLPIEPEWKWLTVAARVRGFDLRPGPGGKTSVKYTLLDADSKPIRVTAEFEPHTEGYTDWQKPTRSFQVDGEARSLLIEIAIDHSAGRFEVDDVMVVPTDPELELDCEKVDAFQAAIQANDAAKVRELVATDKRFLEARDLDFDGGTPLCMTAWVNKPEMTKLLLELGANINGTDRNWKAPAIGWASFWGRPGVAKVLLDAGADPNSANGSGATALESAEFGLTKRKSGDATDDERREVIKLLKDAGGTTKRQATKE